MYTRHRYSHRRIPSVEQCLDGDFQLLTCRAAAAPHVRQADRMIGTVAIERIREQRYRDDRDDVDFSDLHRRSRDHDPRLFQTALRVTTWPVFRLLWRMHHEGRENVPASGPVILAANHASFLDHFLVGHGTPRQLNYMAKSQLFTPRTRTLLSLAGAYPIRRGEQDNDAFETSLAILQRGSLLVTYPQGGRARGEELGARARSGVGRLAMESGAPVVPTAIIGSARIREWKRGHFPAVTVRYGEPIQVARQPNASRDDHQALADEVMERIRMLYRG